MKKLPLNVGEDVGLFGARPVGDSTLRDEFNNGQEFSCEMTSGSGSGFPKLIARSFAKDIVNNLHLNYIVDGIDCETYSMLLAPPFPSR